MKTEYIQSEEPDLFSYSAGLEPAVKEQQEEEIKGESGLHRLFKTAVFNNDAWFSLKAESYLLQLAYANNKILSLSNSRTRILAHQVESTYKIVSALKQRFLIADEVGLGKTIEAGLVIKEFIYRYNYKRIMIACPASLLYQWQAEMQSKFNEHFVILDRKGLNKAMAVVGENGNPWEVNDKIICSLDFIKNDAFTADLKETKWDAVVFDEAHRLRRDANKSTLAYTAAEIVAERTKSLLLLSATPFRGKLEELYYLIALLDKNILGPFHPFYNEYCLENSELGSLKEKLSQVVIRRTKNEIGGFTKRFAKTIKFELYPDERHLYDETTRYVAEEFNRALQQENRAVGFVMVAFQKLLDSSSHALYIALKRRMGRLQEMVNRAEQGQSLIEEAYVQYDKKLKESPGRQGDFNLLEDFADIADLEDMEDMEERGVVPVAVSVEKTVAELKEEIKTLKRLVRIAERVGENKKGESLLELLKTLKAKGCKKFLIFTQFRTTQDYLENLLSDYSVEVFNGSMNAVRKEDAMLAFKQDIEILIATEAGGEGRNMQFCHVLVNYDLPWSPLKIEQRIGRIHRFGQPRDVLVYNFSTSGTVAERILEVLTNKLRLFEESIGAPDIMLGQIEDELKLNNLFMEMVAGRKKAKAVDEEIEERVEAAKRSYEKISDLTLTGRMDFNYDEYYRITLKEREFCNSRIENFINRLQEADEYYSRYIGLKHKTNGLYPIRSSELDEEVKGKYGTFKSEVALENDNLEFLAFGHPIVNKLIDYCQEEQFGGFTGIKVINYDRPFFGILFNYIVTFDSVSETKEFFPILVDPEEFIAEYELDELERESAQQDFLTGFDTRPYGDKIADAVLNSEEYFSRARKRLKRKVDEKIFDMSDSLDIHIDPELERIQESYSRSIKELEEKLAIQEGQMKWYGKNMKGAITRTRNKISKAERERDHLIARYKGYMGIKTSIQLLNVGIFIVT